MIYNSVSRCITHQNKRLLCSRHASDIYIDNNFIIKSMNHKRYNYKNELNKRVMKYVVHIAYSIVYCLMIF